MFSPVLPTSSHSTFLSLFLLNFINVLSKTYGTAMSFFALMGDEMWTCEVRGFILNVEGEVY
jgi:hypothetical protein